MHCQPSPLTQLINLLTNDQPNPIQLEITILPDRTYKDNNHDDNNDDDSDYYFLKDGIHLGIHAPNLPTLARIFRKDYYSLRKSLLPFILRNDHENDEIQRLWEATSGLLLLCPDHATAWSDRKRMLIFFTKRKDMGNHSLWKEEIEYLNLLFSQHSKA
jgi:hypothetical protein